MKRILTLTKDFRPWMIGVLCSLLFVSGVYAGPVGSIDPKTAQATEMDMIIMEVHQDESFIIANEKRIEIARFQVGNDIYQTQLLDENGNVIPLASFRKKQRIHVKGYITKDELILATAIQKLISGRLKKALPLEPIR
ncbi:MAG: hypothetical protein A2V65_07845 [Deltaproteobacteria bacterium RBG_13_49_15]|nr:MAG: hypothetical protein A2V65_07845 [Deltaproteobacteria bacterium RBG_13_49_15]